MGQPGHALAGYLEVADTVESARNSGLWKQDPAARTVTGITTTSSNTNISSATAQFASADLGKTIPIPGSGSGGADLIARINFCNGPSALGLSAQALTAASNVSATLSQRYTQDGLHPNSDGHVLMASGVNAPVMDA